MRVAHKLTLVGVGIAAIVATGSFAAIAATSSHDPNVVGGRFCVDFGTNTAHYDWNNIPCKANQYVDQNTYSQPVIPADVDNVAPVLTGTYSVPFSTNPFTVTIAHWPVGATLNDVVAVTATDPTDSISVPFTFTVNDSATGKVTITFVGTGNTPDVGDTITFTYGYTPQG